MLVRATETMSATQPPGSNAQTGKADKAEPDTKTKSDRFSRVPGLRGVQTTTLFRAINPELFIKPNRYVMAFGLVTLSMCVAYLAYMRVEYANSQAEEQQISPGRRRTRWD
ncbi:small integral membrane protein 8 [Petromyzon marinus]|uniref:small integral membrane protein 8 n=1 Tax=Petromyzon marinus TaxID=7757 RepID=UPI003F7171B3